MRNPFGPGSCIVPVAYSNPMDRAKTSEAGTEKKLSINAGGMSMRRLSPTV